MATAADTLLVPSTPQPNGAARKATHIGATPHAHGHGASSFAKFLTLALKADPGADPAALTLPATPATTPATSAATAITIAAATTALTTADTTEPAATDDTTKTTDTAATPATIPTAAVAAAGIATPTAITATTTLTPAPAKPTVATTDTDAAAIAPATPADTAAATPAATASNTPAADIAAPIITAALTITTPANTITTPATAITTPTTTKPATAVPLVSPAGPGKQREAAAIDTAAPAATQDASASAGAAKAAPAAGNAATSPSAAHVQTANQQNVQAQARPAVDAAAPDVKIDVAAVTSTGTSTPAPDALALRAHATDARPATPPALQSAPAAAVQVYTRFVERFDGRAQRFEMSLDPAELGRVDVRIEVGADKRVHAVLAAHDSAALTDLMRGQRALERALSDAGIDLADNGLRFELSDNSGRNLSRQQGDDARAAYDLNHAWRGFSIVDVPVEAGPDIATATRAYGRRSSRFDLMA